MEGILLVNKPAGISSFGVVARIRRLLSAEAGHKIKIGHCGTLDPFATGLLILVIGSYTKRAQDYSKLDKTYEAELTLGTVSSTGDTEGELTLKSTHRPSEAEIRAALNKFFGKIEQVPPAFSAIKVNGQRAYKLARQGKEVKIESRQVNIYSISDVMYHYPKLNFVTEVSSGTYIRSLAEDIGQALGTGAYLTALHRTRVGDLSVQDAIDWEKASSKQLIKVAKTV